jgi:RNA polymerase sigma factor (sigma-70 family)
MTEQSTVPHQAASGSDEQALLLRLRGGEDAAFGELFELHSAAVRRLARSMASDQSEAEDITAETFFRVLQAIRRGAGPREYVRAYLLTVARRVSWEWHGARRDVPVSDDELTFRAGAGADTHARSAEHTLITTAFTSLPERWRTVLWQTEVEGEQPAMVAPHFGLSANATAALARRARQGLRAAYLQAHLAVNRSSDGCRAVVEKLGSYTAGSVTGAEARRIRTHLLGCSSCQATHNELRDVCSSLRAHAGAVLLLVPAAALGLGGGGSIAGGVTTAMKSLLFGSKVKIGLALASTAAAGAFGITVGPAIFNTETSQTISLPGGTGPELRVVEPAPPAPTPQKVTVGTGELTVQAAQPVIHTVQGDVAAGVPQPPRVAKAPGVAGAENAAARRAVDLAGPAAIPPYQGPATTQARVDPRVDMPSSSPTYTKRCETADPGVPQKATPEDSPDAGEPSCSNQPSHRHKPVRDSNRSTTRDAASAGTRTDRSPARSG